MESYLVHNNKMIDIIHRAGKMCVNADPFVDSDKQAKYIENIMRKGHTSISEHSNIIMVVEVTKKRISDLIELTPYFKYLNFKIYNNNSKDILPQDAETMILLLGGSIRAYKHIFENFVGEDNKVLSMIKHELEINISHQLFPELVAAGVMSIRDTIKTDKEIIKNFDIINDEYFDIISYDHIEDIMTRIRELCLDPDMIRYNDLLDMCTITVIFKKISRPIANQLVRHRNAITQESQRYVSCTGKDFLHPDGVDIDTTKIRVNGEELSLKQYVDNSSSVYGQLVEVRKLKKEQARAYTLASMNTKVMVTFTYRNLIKFLELRTDLSTQPDFQIIAKRLESQFKNIVTPLIGDIYKYLTPAYALSEIGFDYNKLLDDDGFDAGVMIDGLDEDLGVVTTVEEEIDLK